MATSEEYEARIRQFDWHDLLNLWEQIRARNTPDWEAGKAFEYLIIRAFKLENAEVRYPYIVTSGDVQFSGDFTQTQHQLEQIDGIVYVDGLHCMVECKDTLDPVNVEPLTKLRTQLARRPSQMIGLIFSYGGYTEPAVILAHYMSPQTILLWSGSEVEYVLRNRSMRDALNEKYRRCVEYGSVNHTIKSGRLR